MGRSVLKKTSTELLKPALLLTVHCNICVILLFLSLLVTGVLARASSLELQQTFRQEIPSARTRRVFCSCEHHIGHSTLFPSPSSGTLIFHEYPRLGKNTWLPHNYQLSVNQRPSAKHSLHYTSRAEVKPGTLHHRKASHMNVALNSQYLTVEIFI